ncbi:hypothetical protein C0991_006993 [Blastosporella zonata]|nr:hypothetical protein C0991_006993 [Blastosporella zonata]
MNTVNASTGFSGFQLKSGFSPKVLPTIILRENTPDMDHTLALKLIQSMELDFLDAMDSLTASKLIQSYYANQHRDPEVPYEVGDMVMLSTLNRRREYLHTSDGQ